MTAHPIRYLVLWLTTACNLRCAYCYRGEEPPTAMPLDVAQAALRLAGASGLPFHVQLAGGEPTLEPGLVEDVGRLVRSAAWPATVAMQTNGVLLDARLLAVCKRCGIDINVSIDGPPPVQERIRGNAKDSFRGLDLLSRSEMQVRVTTVLSDANAGHLDELVLCLAAFPCIRGVAVNPLVRKGRALTGAVGEASPAAVRNNVRRMLEMLRQINRLRAAPIHWREHNGVCRSLRGDSPIRAYCHACRGESLAVHPDGTVYPCGQTIGDPIKASGKVDCVDWTKLKTMFQGVRLQGNCGECALDGRCPGDCPSRLQYGDATSPKVMCTVYETIAEWIAEKETS